MKFMVYFKIQLRIHLIFIIIEFETNKKKSKRTQNLKLPLIFLDENRATYLLRRLQNAPLLAEKSFRPVHGHYTDKAITDKNI